MLIYFRKKTGPLTVVELIGITKLPVYQQARRRQHGTFSVEELADFVERGTGTFFAGSVTERPKHAGASSGLLSPYEFTVPSRSLLAWYDFRDCRKIFGTRDTRCLPAQLEGVAKAAKAVAGPPRAAPLPLVGSRPAVASAAVASAAVATSTSQSHQLARSEGCDKRAAHQRAAGWSRQAVASVLR